ncbi:MAG: DUF1616 domain-containing protein [Candidatus Obscuribacterales bacterium]|nr:DUF1616 domain-containing protein [Candidatus Obscuribacterales bacterium]
MGLLLTVLTVLLSGFTACIIGLALSRRWRLNPGDRDSLAGLGTVVAVVGSLIYACSNDDLSFLSLPAVALTVALAYGCVVLAIKLLMYGIVPSVCAVAELLVQGLVRSLAVFDRLGGGERRIETTTDEVTALREQVADLQRQLTEARQGQTPQHPA